ncbi:hypothetical protein ABZT43_41920, partial [Streptomyces sp. NPDC005349]
MSRLHHGVRQEAVAVASRFRDDFFDCLTVRGDTLFGLVRENGVLAKALADPTRRRLLDRLREHNGQTLRELCERLD